MPLKLEGGREERWGQSQKACQEKFTPNYVMLSDCYCMWGSFLKAQHEARLQQRHLLAQTDIKCPSVTATNTYCLYYDTNTVSILGKVQYHSITMFL